MVVRQNWFDVRGDETLALDWDIDEESLVWEIGGYEGRWAAQIWEKFRSRITIFEPQDWAYKKLLERFNGTGKIKVFPFGIWTTYGSIPLGSYETDGASMFSKKEPQKKCLFLDYPSAFKIDQGQIGVGLMNIEGGEYTLISEFVRSGYVKRFENFWCQFHPEILGGSELEQMTAFDRICAGMGVTHEILWDCYPTAVAWRKR